MSIARRLQDPLAELVKIDPKAIGVGQYQHDMPEKRLDETLKNVVEDCVNSVGVDVNTASRSFVLRCRTHGGHFGEYLSLPVGEWRFHIAGSIEKGTQTWAQIV